jgi:hypothetical protein
MNDLWEHTIKEEKLAKLRKKWVAAKKAGDEVMCAVIERQAKAVKLGS